MIGTPDDFRSYCKKLIDYAGRNGGFIVGSSACVIDAKEREKDEPCSNLQFNRGSTGCPVMHGYNIYRIVFRGSKNRRLRRTYFLDKEHGSR